MNRSEECVVYGVTPRLSGYKEHNTNSKYYSLPSIKINQSSGKDIEIPTIYSAQTYREVCRV